MVAVKKNSQLLILTLCYTVVCIGLFLYSYTQVDLNLTLSRASFFQTIQKAFQYIGYFQRPLSTEIYVGIISALFLLYLWAVTLASREILKAHHLWRLVILIVGVTFYSYPAAFSYDFFNYMFDAKTVLIYHKNPYEVTPLQFVGVDPWTNFMRWTHLPSAYPPFWILLTLLPYLLGFGYFLLIIGSIKLMEAGFYLLAVKGVEKVLEVIQPPKKVLGMVIFALNPLVLVETLVSGHNDIVMMAIVMWAIYFWLKKDHWGAAFLWALSVGTKLMTLILVPFLYFKFNKWWALALMVLAFILVQFEREVLTWYWVWVMPFVALIPESPEITMVAGAMSLGLLLRYIPYLYFGNYDWPVPAWKFWLTWPPVILAIIFILARRSTKLFGAPHKR